MDLGTSPSRLPGGRSSRPVTGRRGGVVIATAALLGLQAIAGCESGGREESPGGHQEAGSFPTFGEVTLTSRFSVDGAGRNVDTIAFWDAPEEADSREFVTSKGRPLVEIWQYPFSSAEDELTPLSHSCLQAGPDSATNGVVVDQDSDLLYVASNHSPHVCVFSLPDLTFQRTITSGTTYGLEPNLALLTLSDGSSRLYVSDDDVVHVHDAVTGRKLSEFTPTKGVETMWGDSLDEVLYLPDENDRTGVQAYDPNGGTYERDGRSTFGDGPFDADAEGILEYTCPRPDGGDRGTGLIVVSDQIESSREGNDYEIFDRRSWEHLGKIKLRTPDGAEYVHNTDGIGTTQQESAEYPLGLFTAVDDDAEVAGIGWDEIFDAISAEIGSDFGCR